MLAILLLGLVAGLSATVLADWTIIDEDFTGADGAILDPVEWGFVNESESDNASIRSDTMRVVSAGEEPAYLLHRALFRTDQFYLDLDFKASGSTGLPFYLIIVTNDVGRRPYDLWYDPSVPEWVFAHEPESGGGLITHNTPCDALPPDVWYTVHVSFIVDRLSLAVNVRSSGVLLVSESYSTYVPALEGYNTVGFGARQSETFLDNLAVTGYGDAPNRPPVWGPVPEMHAVEDVPFVYNFTGNITDPEDPPSGLQLTTSSPYVDGISGLEVTFLFPEEIGVATVWMDVLDSEFHDQVAVHFTVQPRNDPPRFDLAATRVEEDSPTEINLTANVRDDDSALWELSIVVDDPHATAVGLLLTVLITEEVYDYVLWFNVSDGQDLTGAKLKLMVTRVDDAPRLEPLGRLVAREDEPTTFDLGALVQDVDTPLGDLYVTTDEPSCKVVGLELQFTYATGGLTDTVSVTVTSSPGKNATGALVVEVVEVNDAPAILSGGWVEFDEDTPFTIDLSRRVHDEETPNPGLTLNCTNPNVVAIDGWLVTVLYDRPGVMPNLNFTVSDGQRMSWGSLRMHSLPVNDAPVIARIGELAPPFVITVYEGTDTFFQVIVEDEDDTEFGYAWGSTWDGVHIFTNGTMRIAPMLDELGDFTFTVTASDDDGANATVTVIVNVLNFNLPPNAPIVVQPKDGETHEEGTRLTFKVICSDHDLPTGSVLTVTWSSNASGRIGAATGTSLVALEDVLLPAGIHNITITVSDGELESVAHTNLTITPKQSTGPTQEEEEEGFLPGMTVAAATVVLAGTGLMARGRRRRA